MKKDVLVIGELNVDILLDKVRGFPVIGQEILADEMTFTLGSSSAIFAANLASLGVSTSFCGLIGTDIFGNYIIGQLNNKKVDTGFVIAEPLKMLLVADGLNRGLRETFSYINGFNRFPANCTG